MSIFNWPDLAPDLSKMREAYRRDRRERIATACLAGILSDHTASDKAEHIAWVAVQYADALIAELDKPKEVKP